MNKITINVPRGIRYISEWNEFKLPGTPTIINKQICGCGFTEWCLSNSDNVILVSPRKVLLENKASQHKTDSRLLYVRNDGEKVLNYDEDLTKPGKDEDKTQIDDNKERVIQIQEAVRNHYYSIPAYKGCKFSVTYDSFRHVKEALGESIKHFYIVIDEMQSVFIDAKFKPTTGIELLDQLNGLNRVCFVSATPMLDKYLNMMEEFNRLDYIELDWGAEDPSRVTKPQFETYPCTSVLGEAAKVIGSYLKGNYEVYSYKDESGKIQEIVSNEAVLYVNSVKTICDIIKKCFLTLDNTNIICANTEINKKKLRAAFGIKKKDPWYESGGIGRVPEKGEPHKMFTLCTRTVYLGADFYSTCARTFIFSDANIDSLSVDVSMDLPQILGRQRLNENPWKNRAVMYYKIIGKKKKITQEEFETRIKEKWEKTESLLRSFNNSDTKDKQTLAEVYLRDVKTSKYSENYVSVNKHISGILIPEFNKLIQISEMRCFEIQQIDYKDRVTLFSSLSSVGSIKNTKLEESISRFNSFTQFTDKMRFLCSLHWPFEEIQCFLCQIPIIYRNYYEILGPEKCKALSYQNSLLEKEYNSSMIRQGDELENRICSTFKVGERYTKQYIKDTLRNIYTDIGELELVPKATDLNKWFDVSECKIPNKETGKRDKGFEILKKL